MVLWSCSFTVSIFTTGGHVIILYTLHVWGYMFMYTCSHFGFHSYLGLTRGSEVGFIHPSLLYVILHCDLLLCTFLVFHFVTRNCSPFALDLLYMSHRFLFAELIFTFHCLYQCMLGDYALRVISMFCCAFCLMKRLFICAWLLVIKEENALSDNKWWTQGEDAWRLLCRLVCARPPFVCTART